MITIKNEIVIRTLPIVFRGPTVTIERILRL